MNSLHCYRVTVENPKQGRRIFITDDLYGLEYAFVEANTIPTGLGSEWDCAGVYILLTGWSHGIWTGYLGESQQMKVRHSQHTSVKDTDTPVLLVRRATEDGFTSADIALIERRLALHLAVSDTALPINRTLPKGAVATGHQHFHADIICESIRGVLTLLGYPVHLIDIDAGKTDAVRIPWQVDGPDPNDDPITDDEPVAVDEPVPFADDVPIDLTDLDLTDLDPGDELHTEDDVTVDADHDAGIVIDLTEPGPGDTETSPGAEASLADATSPDGHSENPAPSGPVD